MDCSFCSVTRFNGRKFRRRPVSDVVNELASIDKKFITILDDNILGHKADAWLYDFFNELIVRRIKKYYFVQTSINFGEDEKLVRLAHKAGVRVALIGVESVEQETLKNFNKRVNSEYFRTDQFKGLIRNIRKNGIAFLGCFILGGDKDTAQSFDKTLKFIAEVGIDILQITKPTPLPGTRFYSELADENRIIDTDYPQAWKNHTFTRLLFIPKNLSQKDVYEGFYYIRYFYYRWPFKIKRYIRTLVDTKSLSTAFTAYLFNRSYEKLFKNSEASKDLNLNGLREKFQPQ